MSLENVKEPETLDPLLLGSKPSTLKVSQQSGSGCWLTWRKRRVVARRTVFSRVSRKQT